MNSEEVREIQIQTLRYFEKLLIQFIDYAIDDYENGYLCKNDLVKGQVKGLIEAKSIITDTFLNMNLAEIK